MSKPTALPTWATAGTNNTEPSSGQKASGWTPNEVGNSSYENWRANLVYQWLQWLDGVGIIENLANGAGTLNLDLAVESVPSMAYTGTPAVRKYLGAYKLLSSGLTARAYAEGGAVTGGPGLLVTLNAAYNYSTTYWAQDDASYSSFCLIFGTNGGVGLYKFTAGEMPSLDVAFLGGTPTQGGFELIPPFGGLGLGQVLGTSPGLNVMRPMGPGAGAYAHEPYKALTLNTGWTAPSGNPKLVTWLDAFGLVHVFGSAVGVPSSSVQATTLPSGYHPSAVITGTIGKDTSGNDAVWLIDTTGKLFFITNPTFGSAESFSINTTFPVDMQVNP